MTNRGAQTLLLAVLIVSAAASQVDNEDEPHLLKLSDRNFEHDTQAATGQTTGAWLVLFEGTDGESYSAERALRTLLGEWKLDQPLFAKVDVVTSPKTTTRFSVTNPPVLKLFRDMKMYSYSGEWSAESISEFIKHGWEQTEAEEVPPEIGFLETFELDYYEPVMEFLGSHPMALATLGSVVAMAAYAMAKISLNKKKKRVGKRPVRRPKAT